MKKHLFLKSLLIAIGLLVASVNSAWGQTFGAGGQQQTAIQSQQIMNGGAYKGTVYEPFSGAAPSEAYNPTKVNRAKRGDDDFDPSEFDTPGDAGTPSNESPIGEPWVMLLLALALAGVIAYRRMKNNLIKHTNMKNSTSKFIATLALLCTIGVGQMWADSSVKGAVICYYNGSGSDKEWEANSGSPLNLGTVTTLYLKGFKAYVGDENVCQNTCIYYGFDSGTSLGSYNISDPESWSGSQKEFKNTTGINRNILTSSGIMPGANTLYLKIIAHGKKGGDNCGELTSPTYQIKFNYYPDLWVPGDNWGLGNWDNTTAGYKMSKNTTTGIYTKSIDNVSQADHKFKVSTYNGGQWLDYSYFDASSSRNVYSQSNSSGNIQFQPAMAGTVTVKYTGSTHKISIECAAPTITFDKEGGSDGTDSQNTYYGETPSNISVPSKDYYDFAGYWTGDNGTGTEVINSSGAWKKNITNFTNNDATAKWIVRANYTLHAKWTPKNYNITYKDKGNVDYSGSNIGSLPGSYTYGTGIGSLTAGEKTGYTFNGWYSTSACTGDPVISISSSTHGDQTLYAKWTANTYKITFDATTNGGTITNNGSTYEEDGARKVTATYDATVAGTMPTATKNGYYFKGWYTASSGGSCVINASGVWQNVAGYTNSSKQWKRASATTLYAQYGAPVISISFSPGNVLPVDTITITPSFDHDPEGASSLCFVLVTASGQEMQVQPTWVPGTGKAMKFEAPSAPGDYSVDVRLFNENNHDCSDRTTGLVSSYLSRATTFTVEEANAVTVKYMCGSVELRPSTTVYATAYQTAANVTAPEIAGLSFTGWTKDAQISYASGSSSTPEISIHASSAGTLTANYSQTGYVYFKNTLGWEHVYLYKYNNNSYWGNGTDSNYGTGAHKTAGWDNLCTDGPLEMTLVEGTDDLYAVKPASGVPSSGQSFVFTNSPSTEDFFGKTTGTSIEVVRVTTNYDATNHMIVPNKTGRTYQYYSNRVKYYRDYFEAPTLMDWDWTLRGDWGWSTPSEYGHFTAPKMGSLTFQATHYFDAAGQTKYFLVYDHFGNARGKSSAVIDGTTTTPTEIATGSNLNITLKTTYRGEYIFTITFGHATNQVGGFSNKIHVSVTYPVKAGDYRLNYTTKHHPGDVISKRANGIDTVSMYVAAGNAANLKIQTCASVASTSVTWNSPAVISYADGVNFAAILSEGGSGVYNFVIEQDANGANPKVTAIEKYKGDYYVRTDCTNSYHKNYKDVKDDCQMTYSEYSMSSALAAGKQYSHYYVKDLHGSGGSPINIRFTVATDYSEAITDTVINGITTPSSDPHYDFYGSESLNRVANVRFSYNEATNEIWRAYTEGPTNNNYMVLRTDGVRVYATSAAVSPTSTYKFADMGNWVYQVDVYATATTYVKLTAEMHNSGNTANTQYLKGISGNGPDGTAYTSDDAVILLGGTAVKQHMRIVYDFKTDRMVSSWLPSGAVSGESDIHADVMLIRNGQDETQQITFAAGDDNKLTDVKTVYGVMEIDSSYVNNIVLSRYARSLYWLSFPFDVKVRDIFGFGTYGKHWILEYYDGMGRAKNGWWVDSEPNWKYITPSMKDTFVLEANTGYVLSLNLNKMADGCTDVWVKDVNTVYLYFPSATELGTIQNVASLTMPLSQDGYQCEIDRTGNDGPDTNKNRKIVDSYWHCIGVPSFAQNSLSGTATSSTWESNIPYVYEWSPITNRLYVNTSGSFTFKPMHAYLVQYDGTSITWSNVSHKPLSIVARQKVEGAEADFYEWNLNLMQGAEELDHTYVRMTTDENATEGFDFGRDLTKEINAGANIYTFSTYVPVAGNCLPLDLQSTKTVRVGVQIAADGEYTFAMPEGTNGVGVVLIDNIAGTRTNLALTDYTVNLTAGTIDDRFALELSPIAQVPTGIDLINGENDANGVRKVVVDGVLYIVKEGKVFDARGNRIQ